MADGNQFELDIAHYKALCEKHGVEFWDSDAEDFAYSVATRVVDGGQSEEAARTEQFAAMTGVRYG